MKKVCCARLTAVVSSENFSETVKSLFANEHYYFMNIMKDTHSYWKYFSFDVFAMVKQIRLPTFYTTLICADFHWNELASIIAEVSG